MEGDWVPHWKSSERGSLWATSLDSEADIGADAANWLFGPILLKNSSLIGA